MDSSGSAYIRLEAAVSLTEREFKQAHESGAAARRGGRPVGACPFRGKTEHVRRLAEAWRSGWAQQDEERGA